MLLIRPAVFKVPDASSTATPVSSKKLKQSSIYQFLTPVSHNIPITPPITVPKSIQRNVNSLFQNPLVSISNALDIPGLPGGLFVSKQVIGDGNCLPRSILLAMTGSQDSHADLRQRAINFIRNNASCFLSDIQLLGYSSVEAYCSIMSKNAEFGDAVMLMACSITENVSVQLFTCNCHESNIETVQTMSSQTFSPMNDSTTPKFIQVYLDTEDSQQIRQGGFVIGRKQTRAPHYDALKINTPLRDITNLQSNQFLSTPTRRARILSTPLPSESRSKMTDALDRVLI